MAVRSRPGGEAHGRPPRPHRAVKHSGAVFADLLNDFSDPDSGASLSRPPPRSSR